MARFLKRNGLTLTILLLFALALVAQTEAGLLDFN